MRPFLKSQSTFRWRLTAKLILHQLGKFQYIFSFSNTARSELVETWHCWPLILSQRALSAPLGIFTLHLRLSYSCLQLQRSPREGVQISSDNLWEVTNSYRLLHKRRIRLPSSGLCMGRQASPPPWRPPCNHLRFGRRCRRESRTASHYFSAWRRFASDWEEGIGMADTTRRTKKEERMANKRKIMFNAAWNLAWWSALFRWSRRWKSDSDPLTLL